MALTQKQLEQEQLIGYWAKTQGFSHKSLMKADINVLQAVKVAKNTLKYRLRQKHSKPLQKFLLDFHRGKDVTEQLPCVRRTARHIQRLQARSKRKATL
jgi:hypothetical protein